MTTKACTPSFLAAFWHSLACLLHLGFGFFRFSPILLVVLGTGPRHALGQPGVLDSAFGSGLTLDGLISTLAVQADGKVLLGGQLTAVSGGGRRCLARLTAAGALDSSFQLGTGANDRVSVLAIQADGKIVFGGRFTSFDDMPRARLARLTVDGRLDPDFDPGGGPNSDVNALVPLPTGELLIGGSFDQVSGVSRGFLARLEPSGALDAGFTTSANGSVEAMLLQPDGKIVIGGRFTSVNGVPRNRVARLNADGTVDFSFDPGAGPNNTVRALALQPGGRLIMGGEFTSINGASSGCLARLTPEGLPDLSFAASVNGPVFAVAVQSDGKAVVGGAFAQAGDQARSRIARFSTDGALDLSFDPGSGFDGDVFALAVQGDGNLLAGGAFARFNEADRPYLARLLGLSSASGGELEFGARLYSVSESAPLTVIEVRRAGNTSSSVTVEYATSNGTANAGDYTPQAGKLAFGPGETSKTFPIPIRSDTAVEDNETINLSLKNPTGGAVLGTQRSAVVIIVNDDRFDDAGSLDVSYMGSLNGGCNAMALQPDGKLVVVGPFSGAGGLSRFQVARFNPDGTVDTSFLPSAWLNEQALAVTAQGDGKVLLAGRFTVVNGVTRNRVARLNADGTLDPLFDPGGGPNGDAQKLVVLPTGDILIAGAFSQYNGLNRGNLARIYTDGNLDTSFAAEANGTVFALEVQSDGRILIGGDFSAVNGQARNRVARLNPDGTLDRGFDPAVGPNGTVYSVALQPNGQVVIGGIFSLVNGASVPYLARLTAEGLPDLSFNAGLNSAVYAVALQADGKILAGGAFSQARDQTRNRIVRLRSDGSVDPAFDIGSGFNDRVNALAVQFDGQIVVGGYFTQFNGLTRIGLARLQALSTASGGELQFGSATYSVGESVPSVSIDVRRTGKTGTAVAVEYTTSNGTANAGDYTPQAGKLEFGPDETLKSFTLTIHPDSIVEGDETVNLTLYNPTNGAVLGSQRSAVLYIVDDDAFGGVGNLDVGFDATLNGPCNAIAVQTDGRLIAVGPFTAASGMSRLQIARFNPDGTVDPTFYPNTWLNDQAFALALQSDGKILLAGRFTQVNGLSRPCVARLNTDGTLDRMFDPSGGPHGDIYALAVLPTGGILIGGSFTRVGLVSRPYLARLYTDGNLDPSFTAEVNGTVRSLGVQSDGRILLAGHFIMVNGQIRNRVARLNADGGLDPTFDPGAGPDANVTCLALQPDGKVLIGGMFTLVNGAPLGYLARLNGDGLPDLAFNPGLNGAVSAVVVQPDDMIMAGGSFTQARDQTRNRIVRLRRDGSVDPSFEIGSGFADQVNALALQLDGNILVGGNFTQFNGLSRPYLARLLGLSSAVGGQLEFAAATFSVKESAPTATIQVRRTGNNNNAVTVDYATSNGSANAGDYTPQAGKLVFGPRETSNTFTIPIRSDNNVEDDETVNLRLMDPTGGAVLGSQQTAVLFILNDDSFTGAGSLDVGFSSRLDAACHTLALQNDGKVIAAGAFTAANGLSRLRVARFNADGALDGSFAANTWCDNQVLAVTIQSEGKILLGGRFALVNGFTRNRLARLNGDGRLDFSFDPGDGPNGEVTELAFSTTGDILVAGSFTQYGGANRGYLARIYTDGSLDSNFAPTINATVSALGVQADGKILLAGDFTLVNDQPRNRVARLNSDGSLDATFDPGSGPNSGVYALAIQADGKVVIGGAFNQVTGVNCGSIARLEVDGSLDTSFGTEVGANGNVYALVLQPDSDVVIGGSFSSVNGLGCNNLARLNSDGTNDPDFAIGSGANGQVNALALQADGALIVGGNFTQFNGLNRPYLVRLQGASLVAPLKFAAIDYLLTDEVRLTLTGRAGQKYALQVSADLSSWVSLSTNIAPATSFELSVPNPAKNRVQFYRAISLP
jgi:uncharacterized delta-60 repeat protein